MLEKFCDAKNTFEGKALAAFMAAVLAFSLVNLSSLADAAENGAPTDAPEAQVDNPSTEVADNPASEPAPAAESEATAPLETPAVSEAAAQSQAPAAEPSAPAADLPTAEPGVAVVGLEFQHAYVAYLGQTIALPADSINVPLNKELSFAAYADEGYEISAVKAVVKGVEAELRADATTGEYKVPAEQVTSNLILKVEAKAAEAETSELETPAAEPITSDMKIGEDGAGGPEADGSDNGGPDAIEDDVVEVEADVSSPAFEGYAQAGNVLVKVTAAEGVLPEGTTVQAVQITSSAVIDAVEAAVEEKGKELENAVAVDVTLLGPDGSVIQPDAAVNVCFFNAGVSGEAMGVYHVANDGSSVSAVSARQADAAAQSFDVSHFSIYVVTAEGTPKLATYNFYGVDGALVGTQIVKTGESLFEPEAPPVADGQFFQGWYTKNGEDWAGRFVDFGAQVVTESFTSDLYAKVSGACYVYFMDNGGRVYSTKSGADGDVVAADVAFPLAPNESVTGWYTEKELVNRVDSVTLGAESIMLYPKVETGVWMTFDAKGGSYTEPEFVSVGGTSVEPAAPTRAGYRFAGWFADEECSKAYKFGSSPSGDTTLYAKWEAATAKYSVAVWLEAADSTRDASRYDYVTTLDYEGTTDEEEPLPSASDIKQNVAFLIDGKYILNESNESSDKTVTVKGDGTAIANVYLDRAEFTVDLRCSAKGESGNKKDYVTAYQITANYGADIADQWDAATKAVSAKYGTRVWVEDPKNPGTTINPVVAPFRTMTEDMTLFYVNNGSALHHLELRVEKVGNTTPIKKTDPNFPKYNSGYRYQNNYDTSMFENYDTLVFRGAGVHAEIQNYVNALNGFEWVGADLAKNQGFFQIGNTWTARHYFERKSYTITFNNQGAMSTSAPIKYGTSIEGEGSAPSAKDAGVPEGSTFAGWYTSPTFAAGTEFSFDGATMPANNVVLYAKWILPTYQVTYYQDMGGTALAKENAVGYGETAIDEPSSIASVPEGYKWVGWTTRSGSEGDYTYRVFNFDTQVYGDVELYPYYINDEKRSVAYDANGGVGEVPTDDRSYAQGSFAKVAESTLSASTDGDRFLGWNTKEDGSGATYYPGGMVQLGEANVTLYAQWGPSVPQTSLTYDPNGGAGDALTETGLPNNGEVTLKTADALDFAAPRAGVHFAGWNTAPDGSGASFAGGTAVRVDLVGNGNILYAQWALNTNTPYTVERYLQNLDGSYPDTATYTDGTLVGTTDQLVSADTSVAYPGFTFDAGNASNVLEGTVAGDGSLVLKVHYERNAYKVAYELDGGDTTSPDTTFDGVKYGALTPAIDTPTRLGYTFQGWDPAVSPTVTGNAVYTAQWQPLPDVSLEYVAEGAGGSVIGKDGEPGQTATERVSPLSGEPHGAAAVPNAGYRFAGWFVDGQLVSDSAQLDRAVIDAHAKTGGLYVATTFVARFAESENVTLSFVAETGGSVDPASEEVAPATGEPKGSTATAEAGYTFAGWFVDGQLVSDSARLDRAAIDAHAKSGEGLYRSTTFTARFMENEATLAYASADESLGTVDPKSETVAVKTGVPVGSVATPAADCYFVGWSAGTDPAIISEDPTLDKAIIDEHAKKDGLYEGAAFVAHFAKKKELVITSKGDTFVYDGTPHRASDTVYEVVGQETPNLSLENLTASAEETDAGRYPVAFSGKENLVLRDRDGLDVTEQYKVSYVEGKLVIGKRPVEVAGEGWIEPQPYKGEEYVKSGYAAELPSGFSEMQPGGTRGLVGGQSIEAAYRLAGADAGSYTGIFSGTPTVKDAAGNDVTDNYDISTKPGTLKIVPSETQLVITAATTSWRYDGQPHADGTYAVTYGGVPVTPNESGEYVLPTGDKVSATVEGSVKNVGDTRPENNQVTSWSLENKANYANVVANTGTLSITPREVTLTSATDSKPYDGTPLVNKTVRVTEGSWAAGQGARYEVTGTQTLVGFSENSFAYTLTGGASEDNYDIKTVFGSLTVTNADALYAVTVTAKSGTATYNGSEQEVSGLVGETERGVRFEMNGQDFFVTGLTARGAGTDAGDYPSNVVGVPVVRDAEGNDVTDQFKVDTVDGALAIGKREVTLASASDEKVYDGRALVNDTVTGSEAFVEGEGATFAVTGSQTIVGSSSNEFTYELTGATKESNYRIATSFGRLKVTGRDDAAKYQIKVEANSAAPSYNGEEQTISGFKQTQFTFNGAVFTVSGLTAEAAGKDVGEYPANVVGTPVVTDEAGNNVTSQFVVDVENGMLSIKKAPLVLASASLSKPYDGTPLVNGETPLAEQSGWVKDEGATYQFTGSVLLPGETQSNEFAIVPNAGTSLDNYELAKTEGQLSIEGREADAKYEITIEANSGETLYDGLEKQVEGLKTTTFAFGDATFAVTGLEARASRTDAGTTTVPIRGKAVVLDAQGNDVTSQFKIDYVPGALEVNPRQVVLTSASAEKPYDGTPLTNDAVTVSGDGWAGDEGAAYDVTGSQTVVGFSDNTFAYTLERGAKAGNYVIDLRFGTLTVTNRDAKYEVEVQANSGAFTYDGIEKSVSGFVGETEDGVPVTVGSSTFYVSGLSAGAALTDADSVPVAVTGAAVVTDAQGNDVSSQFNVKVKQGTLEITPRTVTLTSASATREYNGEPLVAHGVTVSGDGWAEGEGAAYDYMGSQTLVGTSLNYFSYALNANTKPGNYHLKQIEGSLNVTSREAKWDVALEAVSSTVLYNGATQVLEGFVGQTEQGVPVQVEGHTYYVTGLTASAYGIDADTYVLQGTGTPVVTDDQGNNVSEQFAVSVKPGKLVVEPRHVVLESATDRKPYDGSPLVNGTVTVSGDGWAEGEGAAYAVTGSQTLVGSSENVFAYTLEGGAKAGNYVIDLRFGILTVTNRDAAFAVSVQAKSNTVTYDGSEQSVSGFTDETEQGVPVQAGGRTYYVVGLKAEAAGTDAGTYRTTVSGTPAVRDADGNDVTDQFAVTPQAGTLLVEQRPLTLVSASLSKPYDGMPLVNGATPLVTEDGWAEGEGATYVFTGSVALPGEVAANAFVIKANAGTNLGNYQVGKAEGQLSIENRDARYEVELTANSGTFSYNGGEQTVSGFRGETALGVPVQADGRTYYVTGLSSHASGTNVADSVASIPVRGAAVVKDADGNLVSEQFRVKVVPGSFAIEPATLVIAANDAGKSYGQADPALSATVKGLMEGDVFEGTYDVERAPGENAGTYEITVDKVRLPQNGNYTATTQPGRFVIARADALTLVVGDASKPYDGTPLVPDGVTPIGLQQGDTVEVVYGGSQTDAGTSQGTVSGYVVRNAAGEDVTANYPTAEVVPGNLTVVPAAVTITAADASKVAGAEDPAFTGTVEGLVAEGDLGDVTYRRTNADEDAGVYVDVITASYTANPNYRVTVVPGTFAITAVPVPVVPPVPPATPPTPATPATPPTPTPGTVPPDALSILAPIAEVLEDAVTPLAGPQEQAIEDDGTPLAGYDRVNCWVHYYLILGIIVTVLYGAGVLVRRISFTRKLKDFEDDVLGIEDESAAVPACAARGGRQGGLA